MTEKTSPIEVQKFLEGVDYPASKNDLLEAAQNNDASQEVFDTLEKLPEREYNRPTDVSAEIGKI